MRTIGWLGLALVVACSEGEGTPVGATLDDGQVLIGEITTQALQLQGAFGPVAVPLADVGMVLPVEGRTLKDSSSHVNVWLRNGSELRGRWAEPELTMGIAVGGKRVGVEVPAGRMQALQLQGSESWPEDGLYRVRTSWGDDFLVDPAQTRIELENELGSFEPFLTECRAVGPISDPEGDWRIELASGTVLIGPLKTDQIAFALPIGPEEIVVPLASLVALERGAWPESGWEAEPAEQAAPLAAMGYLTEEALSVDKKPEEAKEIDALAGGAGKARRAPPKRPAARPGLTRDAGWFDNSRLHSAKY